MRTAQPGESPLLCGAHQSNSHGQPGSSVTPTSVPASSSVKTESPNCSIDKSFSTPDNLHRNNSGGVGGHITAKHASGGQQTLSQGGSYTQNEISALDPPSVTPSSVIGDRTPSKQETFLLHGDISSIRNQQHNHQYGKIEDENQETRRRCEDRQAGDQHDSVTGLWVESNEPTEPDPEPEPAARTIKACRNSDSGNLAVQSQSYSMLGQQKPGKGQEMEQVDVKFSNCLQQSSQESQVSVAPSLFPHDHRKEIRSTTPVYGGRTDLGGMSNKSKPTVRTPIRTPKSQENYPHFWNVVIHGTHNHASSSDMANFASPSIFLSPYLPSPPAPDDPILDKKHTSAIDAAASSNTNTSTVTNMNTNHMTSCIRKDGDVTPTNFATDFGKSDFAEDSLNHGTYSYCMQGCMDWTGFDRSHGSHLFHHNCFAIVFFRHSSTLVIAKCLWTLFSRWRHHNE